MKKNVSSLQIAISAMIVAAFLLMPLTVNGQAGKANFTGTWALNAEKSNFGQGQDQQPQGQPPQGQGQRQGQPPQDQGQRMGGFGGGMGQNFAVTQEANKLTVERTRQRQDGTSQKITSVYTLDGKECVNTTGRGESKSTATWSADGKSLTIVTNSTFNMNGESRTMTSTQVWSLTGANTLSIKNASATPNGERTSAMVYDKK